MVCLAGTVSLIATQVKAQDTDVTEITRQKKRDSKEIIIRKKTDKDTKVTIEINGEDIRVNGKPLSDFDDKDIEINLENIRPDVTVRGYATSPARSPFRSSLNFQSPVLVTGFGGNRALLGVTTVKADEGAKVNAVTPASAAEKAGVKVGDVITKINDLAIATPEDLSKAVGKFKPEDKVAVTVKRDKKEQKLTAVLAKPAATSTYSQNFNFDHQTENGIGNMNTAPRYNLMLSNGQPRLGIKAQDTDDSKGVKILEVDKNSAAEKSGIKEGDLITEFDGKTVNGTTELMEAARNARDKNNMKVKLMRDGKSQEIDIKIPKKLKTANL